MSRRNAVKVAVEIVYTLAVTFMTGKWAVGYAYKERGYDAVGGEYGLIFLICLLAWNVINYMFDAMEDLRHG